MEESLSDSEIILSFGEKDISDGAWSPSLGTADNDVSPSNNINDSSSKQPGEAGSDQLSYVSPSSDVLNTFGTNGIFARMGEHIPLVNMGIQLLHVLSGDDEALKRAREHDPIGCDGYVTQAFERIPIFSDSLVALHTIRGHDMAAERARAHTLNELLSKDGAITKVAELVPVSNLFAAALHELHGNRTEAWRALNLIGGWAQSYKPDGPFAKVAELLPGADALAFAMHLQGGHYAQALRCLSKTSFVNLSAQQVKVTLQCPCMRRCGTLDIEPMNLEITPRQHSLLVGFVDLLVNTICVDQEGQHRSFYPDFQRSLQSIAPKSPMEKTKELLMKKLDQKMHQRIEYVIGRVPEHVQWLVDIMNEWLFNLRSESLLLRLLAPRILPPVPATLIEAVQTKLPDATMMHGPLPPVEPIRLKRNAHRITTIQATTVATCASVGCCGLGVKALALTCAAGVVAGVVESGRFFARRMTTWVNARNAAIWDKVVNSSQPGQGDIDGPAVIKSEELASDNKASKALAPENCGIAGGNGQMGDPEIADHLADPYGMVFEFREEDASQLASLMRTYMFEDVLGGRWSCFHKLAEMGLHVLIRDCLETEGAVMPVVMEAELEDWVVELEGYSFNFHVPSMRFAVVLHLALDGGVPRTTRAFWALPESLIQRLTESFQAQMMQWDLRELDPRFKDFSKPVRATARLKFTWPSQGMMVVEVQDPKTKLVLPS